MKEIIKDQKIAMVAVLKNKDGKVLIIREASENYEDGNSAGKWTMPGGRLGVGESWEKGIKREALEEIGMKDLQLLKPLYVGEWIPVIQAIRTQIIGIFYLCSYSGEEIKLSNEHDLYKWIGPEEIDKYDYAGPQKEVLEKAFKLGDK